MKEYNEQLVSLASYLLASVDFLRALVVTLTCTITILMRSGVFTSGSSGG